MSDQFSENSVPQFILHEAYALHVVPLFRFHIPRWKISNINQSDLLFIVYTFLNLDVLKAKVNPLPFLNTKSNSYREDRILVYYWDWPTYISCTAINESPNC